MRPALLKFPESIIHFRGGGHSRGPRAQASVTGQLHLGGVQGGISGVFQNLYRCVYCWLHRSALNVRAQSRHWFLLKVGRLKGLRVLLSEMQATFRVLVRVLIGNSKTDHRPFSGAPQFPFLGDVNTRGCLAFQVETERE